MLRDQFRLRDFREPNGFLIIGTEDEFSDDPERQKLKGAWNRSAGNALHVRTWSSIVRDAKHLLDELSSIGL